MNKQITKIDYYVTFDKNDYVAIYRGENDPGKRYYLTTLLRLERAVLLRRLFGYKYPRWLVAY